MSALAYRMTEASSACQTDPSAVEMPTDGVAMCALLADVEAAMRRAINAENGDIASAMAWAHLATGGKRLRARLAAAATLALGGGRASAVAWAAACELAHNATLVHDDLQDGDVVRRGSATVWKRFGAAQAINVGDLLLMAPFMALGNVAGPAEVRYALCQALARSMARVIEGQALECHMTAEHITELASFERMVRGKTAALFALPVLGAALATGLPEEEAQRVSTPFATLGMLFQMQDDLLDLYGDKGREQPGADIREGKSSALVVHHLRLHPSDAPWLQRILRMPRDQTCQADVERVGRRFNEGGARRQVMAAIDDAAQAARASVCAALRPLLDDMVDRVLRPLAPLR